jgi:hypothetical protein
MSRPDYNKEETAAWSEFVRQCRDDRKISLDKPNQHILLTHLGEKTLTVGACYLAAKQLGDKLKWSVAESAVEHDGGSVNEIVQKWLEHSCPTVLKSTIVRGKPAMSQAHADRVAAIVRDRYNNIFSFENLSAASKILLEELAAEDQKRQASRNPNSSAGPGRLSSGETHTAEAKPPSADEVARNEQLLEKTAKSAQAFVLAALQSPPGGASGRNHGVKEAARKAMAAIVREMTSQPVVKPDGSPVDRQSAYYKGAVCRAWVECAKRITSEVIENPEYGGSKRSITG